jgi:hypothetical protein
MIAGLFEGSRNLAHLRDSGGQALHGRGIFRTLPPDDRQPVRDAWQKALEGGGTGKTYRIIVPPAARSAGSRRGDHAVRRRPSRGGHGHHPGCHGAGPERPGTGGVQPELGVPRRVPAPQNTASAKASAEAANQAKSAFLSNMSHEIRTAHERHHRLRPSPAARSPDVQATGAAGQAFGCGPAPAGNHQRHSRPLEDRSQAGRSGGGRLRAVPGRRPDLSGRAREGRGQRSRPGGGYRRCASGIARRCPATEPVVAHSAHMP